MLKRIGPERWRKWISFGQAGSLITPSRPYSSYHHVRLGLYPRLDGIRAELRGINDVSVLTYTIPSAKWLTLLVIARVYSWGRPRCASFSSSGPCPSLTGTRKVRSTPWIDVLSLCMVPEVRPSEENRAHVLRRVACGRLWRSTSLCY